jgi:hypothetical protein
MDGATLLNESTLVANAGPWRVVATGDLNADGMADILWQHVSSNALYAWLMNGTSLIGGGMLTSALTAGWKVVSIADVNGDTTNDLVLQHSVGQVEVRYLNGLTETGSATIFGSSSPWRVSMVADFNGDGHVDVLWQGASPPDLYIWFLNGTTLVGDGYASPKTVGKNWKVVGGK